MNEIDRPSSGLRVLMLLALGRLILHCATNGQYGFHRDELATLDDARHLAWGFVAYPPMTPFFGRLSWELFGPSLIGARFFAALAQVFYVLAARHGFARVLAPQAAALTMAGAAVLYVGMSTLIGALANHGQPRPLPLS